MSFENDKITKLKAGDRDTFRHFVDEFKNKVLNTCYNFVQNRQDAEDLTQEVFIEVFLSIKKFRENSLLSTWLYRIAVSKSLDYLRAKNRKKRKVQVLSIFGIENLDKAIMSQGPDLPDKIMVSDEQTKLIYSKIEKLPENQRVALTLNKLENLSPKEIADIMQTSVSAVESLIQRAKSNLKKKF